MRKLAILALAAFALTACEGAKAPADEAAHDAAEGHAVSAQALVLSDFAVRAALGENPNTAAYVTINNTGTSDDRLVSAHAEWAEKTELHTMETVDGVMKMAAAPEGFVIGAGETVALKPGGNHIMLLGLKDRPQDGETRTIVLTFEGAGEVPLSLPVSQTPQDAHHDH